MVGSKTTTRRTTASLPKVPKVPKVPKATKTKRLDGRSEPTVSLTARIAAIEGRAAFLFHATHRSQKRVYCEQ